MNLFLIRQQYSQAATIGTLLNDHAVICYTLEPVVRASDSAKVEGKTAIPAGRYKVTSYFSPKHQRIVALLNDVPGFQYIEMHSGNTTNDTQGCIIVAYNQVGPQEVYGTAEHALTALVIGAIQNGEEVWIEIVNTFPGTGV